MIYTTLFKTGHGAICFCDKILARRQQRAAPFFKPRQAQDLLISRDNRIRRWHASHRRRLIGIKPGALFSRIFFHKQGDDTL